jgi:hypothetical protein
MRNILRCYILICTTILSSCSNDDAEPTNPEPDPIENPGPEATHHVGPAHTIKTLQEIAGQLQPGNVVEVDGDFEYTGGITLSVSGTIENPIIIRGKSINGKRPAIKQGPNARIIVIDGSNIVLDNIEVIGQPDETTRAGIGVYANNVTIRNCVIHDCRNGILGYGSLTGNVLVEYCEIYNCGGEPKSGFDFAHQIYMATDEVAHPNAVFRLQHSYIHDAKGGNNVKTRSGRNEIYYNWIEGPKYHSLELIGPDLDDNDEMTEGTKREDSDVVGNVLISASNGSAIRLGGDGTGQTKGRYRIVNNTFIIQNNADGLRGNDGIETVELFNNVFYKGSASGADVFSEADVDWENNRQVKGSNNYLQPGLNKIPAGLTTSISTANPGFVDETQLNYTIAPTSSLYQQGTLTPSTFANAAFPEPLFPPAFIPERKHIKSGEAVRRTTTPSNINVGAF